jgi:hypothetical protein
MRLTLVLTIIIFAALLMYAKLLAVAEAPSMVYNANSSREPLGYSAPPVNPSHSSASDDDADYSCDDHSGDDHSN